MANRKRKYKKEETKMRNVFKKMILTAVLVLGTLVVLPTTAEAKTKNLTYNINKVTANKFCENVYTKGAEAHFLEKDKNKYKITITVKAKSEKEGIKKIETFAKKVMKADSNKYGLSYGVSLKDGYNWYRYDEKKKVLTVKLSNTANDLYYLNCITRDALNTKYIESHKCSVKTKSVFPDSTAFKKASESAKTQTVLYYMGLNCMEYDRTKSNVGVIFNWEKAYEGKMKGVCSDFAEMYRRAVRLIAYDYDEQGESNNKANHEVSLMRVKNSSNNYDYFLGDNGYFDSYYGSQDVSKGDKISSLSFAVWQVKAPKLFKVDKLEQGAFNWSQSNKSSDLEKMYMNL